MDPGMWAVMGWLSAFFFYFMMEKWQKKSHSWKDRCLEVARKCERDHGGGKTRRHRGRKRRKPRVVEVDMADEFQKMMLDSVAALTPEERAEMQERMTALQEELNKGTSADPPRNLGDEFADAMADSVAVRCACGMTLTHMGLRESKGVCMKCGTRHRRENDDGGA